MNSLATRTPMLRGPKLETPNKEIVRSDAFYNFLYYFFGGMIPLHKISSDDTPAIPENGPAIILSEHTEWADIPVLAYVAKKKSGRYLVFFAKADWYVQYNGHGRFYHTHITDLLFKLTGTYPVDRNHFASPLNIALYEHLEDLLVNHGEVPVIYPRGTRKQDGNLKKGLIKVVVDILEKHPEVEIPVIPVYIEHFRKIPPLLLNSHVVVGNNIYSPGMNYRELTQITQAEFDRMKQL